MKKLFLTTISSAALAMASGAAIAADLAVEPIYRAPPPIYKAPPAVTPIYYTWTGFYIGGNIGEAWSHQDVATDPVVANSNNQKAVSVDQNTTSLIGGVHGGYNFQFDPYWVVGVEGDWSWTGLDASAIAPNLSRTGAPLAGGLSFSRDTKWLASLRGRVGWITLPNTLFYLTGGAAWTKSDYTGVDKFASGSASASISNTKSGYSLGGGLDYALTNNWIIRTEYLFYNFSGESATGFRSPTTPGVVFNWDDLQIHELRAGASYKF